MPHRRPEESDRKSLHRRWPVRAQRPKEESDFRQVELDLWKSRRRVGRERLRPWVALGLASLRPSRVIVRVRHRLRLVELANRLEVLAKFQQSKQEEHAKHQPWEASLQRVIADHVAEPRRWPDRVHQPSHADCPQACPACSPELLR